MCPLNSNESLCDALGGESFVAIFICVSGRENEGDAPLLYFPSLCPSDRDRDDIWRSASV